MLIQVNCLTGFSCVCFVFFVFLVVLVVSSTHCLGFCPSSWSSLLSRQPHKHCLLFGR
jgi:sulfite exporter TauE/SafE